jgi:hypothetical protein
MPLAHELVPGVSISTSVTLQQAMAKKPENRFAMAGEFAARLQRDLMTG